MPTSYCGSKNILVMVDHLTSWPMVKEIPDKESTTVASAIFDFSVDNPSDNQTGTEPKYNLRRAIEAPTILDL